MRKQTKDDTALGFLGTRRPGQISGSFSARLITEFVCLFFCLFFFGFLVAAAQVGAPRQGLGGSRGDPARFGVPHQRRLPGRATDALRLVVQRFRPGQLGPRPVPPVRLQSRRQGAPFFCFCFSIYSFAVSFRFLGVVLVECGG